MTDTAKSWIEERRAIIHGAREAIRPTEAIDLGLIDLPRTLDALNAVLKVLDDPGGPNSWSHTFQGRHSVFADDVRAAIEGALNND